MQVDREFKASLGHTVTVRLLQMLVTMKRLLSACKLYRELQSFSFSE